MDEKGDFRMFLDGSAVPQTPAGKVWLPSADMQRQGSKVWKPSAVP